MSLVRFYSSNFAWELVLNVQDLKPIFNTNWPPKSQIIQAQTQTARFKERKLEHDIQMLVDELKWERSKKDGTNNNGEGATGSGQ